ATLRQPEGSTEVALCSGGRIGVLQARLAVAAVSVESSLLLVRDERDPVVAPTLGAGGACSPVGPIMGGVACGGACWPHRCTSSAPARSSSQRQNASRGTLIVLPSLIAGKPCVCASSYTLTRDSPSTFCTCFMVRTAGSPPMSVIVATAILPP